MLRRIKLQDVSYMTYDAAVTPKERSVTFRVEADLAAGMDMLRERYGTPFSEQIRRALRAWLQSQGVVKAERPRAGTRRRA
jgi:hypothetical protein